MSSSVISAFLDFGLQAVLMITALVIITIIERRFKKITAILERHEKHIKRLEAQLGTQSKKTPGTLARPGQRRDSPDSR